MHGEKLGALKIVSPLPYGVEEIVDPVFSENNLPLSMQYH